MRIRKRIFFLVSLFVVATCFLVVAERKGWMQFQQNEELPDAKEELKKIISVLHHADSMMHVSGTIRVYDRENKNILQEQSSFLMEKQGTSFYSRLGYVQTIGLDSILVELDTVNQIIDFSKADVSAYSKTSGDVTAMDRYLQDTSVFRMELTLQVIDKNERSITIKNPLTPELKSTTFYYDTQTYQLLKAEADWWKSGMPEEEEKNKGKLWHTVISYKYSRVLTVSAVEKMRSIASFDNGSITLKPAYKNYQFTTSF